MISCPNFNDIIGGRIYSRAILTAAGGAAYTFHGLLK